MSIISESAEQEEEIYQCKNIFNMINLYEKEVEVILKIHSKKKILIIKMNKLLKLLASHLKF